MSEPSPEQSFFSIHLKSLTDFADEFTTQIQSLQSPMDHLATMSGTAPQYGAFREAWSLGAGEQAAVEEMYSLLGQVKTAIAFAGDVTGTVADGYRHADENIAYGLGGPPAGSGGGSGSGPWSNHGHDGGQNHHRDLDQNDQYDQSQPYTAPVSHAAGDPWYPNQNTSGPFPGTPNTAVPVVGALLGGALLAGTARSRSHQPPANTSPHSSVDVSFEVEGSSAQSGALPLWTPPPDPGGPGGSGVIPPAPAPAPVFPGQDAPWTATSPQGGS